MACFAPKKSPRSLEQPETMVFPWFFPIKIDGVLEIGFNCPLNPNSWRVSSI